MNYFLGVDGGQSGTTALIGDETGRVLGVGHGGPANHAAAAEGRARLERAVSTSVGDACVAAGLPGNQAFAAACFGLSGGPGGKEQILGTLVRAEQLIVTTDAEIALRGATETGQGIIVIAGTGSIALGRNAAGTQARAGGWGYVYGDEGSAFDIVRQAMRAALRIEEGWGTQTNLRQVLLDASGCGSANELLHEFYGSAWPRDRVAALAPLVDAAANDGDPVARNVLNAAAQQLAELAAAVRTQLWKDGEPLHVAYAGGVFGSGVLRERFRMLVTLESGINCSPPLYTAAEGALLAAYEAVGLSVERLSRLANCR